MLIDTQVTNVKTQTTTNPNATQKDAKLSQNAGLIAGTLVETATGWRRVELLRVGDHVQTYDGGLQQLRQIDRKYYGMMDGAFPLADTLSVPSGALDNCEELMLMPEQMLLIESHVVTDLLGHLSVLVPAAALEGFRGISRQAPRGLIEAVSLRFDTEEVVYANSGLLAHCGGRCENPNDSFFPVLGYERATALVGLLGQDRNILDLAISKMNLENPALLPAAA